jgi:hypothetical protein
MAKANLEDEVQRSRPIPTLNGLEALCRFPRDQVFPALRLRPALASDWYRIPNEDMRGAKSQSDHWIAAREPIPERVLWLCADQAGTSPGRILS